MLFQTENPCAGHATARIRRNTRRAIIQILVLQIASHRTPACEVESIPHLRTLVSTNPAVVTQRMKKSENTAIVCGGNTALLLRMAFTPILRLRASLIKENQSFRLQLKQPIPQDIIGLDA